MGVSKPTEMTIRDLLQEELRKRGVTVVPEFSVSTPAGVLKPDILLKNGAPTLLRPSWALRRHSIADVRLNRPEIRF